MLESLSKKIKLYLGILNQNLYDLKKYLLENFTIFYFLFFKTTFFYYIFSLIKYCYIFIWINIAYFFSYLRQLTKKKKSFSKALEFRLPFENFSSNWEFESKRKELVNKIIEKKIDSLDAIECYKIFFKNKKHDDDVEDVNLVGVFNIFWIIRLIKTAILISNLFKINKKYKKETNSKKNNILNNYFLELTTEDKDALFDNSNTNSFFNNLFKFTRFIIDKWFRNSWDSNAFIWYSKNKKELSYKELYLDSLEKEIFQFKQNNYSYIEYNYFVLQFIKFVNYFWLAKLNIFSENFLIKINLNSILNEKQYLFKLGEIIHKKEKDSYKKQALFWEYNYIKESFKEISIEQMIYNKYLDFLKSKLNDNSTHLMIKKQWLDISKNLDSFENRLFSSDFRIYINSFIYLQYYLILFSYLKSNQLYSLQYWKLKSIFNSSLYFNLNKLHTKNYSIYKVFNNKINNNKTNLIWLTKQWLEFTKFEYIIEELFVKENNINEEDGYLYKINKRVSKLNSFINEKELFEEIENLINIDASEFVNSLIDDSDCAKKANDFEKFKCVNDSLTSFQEFTEKKNKIIEKLKKSILKHNYKVLNEQIFQLIYFVLNNIKGEDSLISEKELKKVFNANQELFYWILKGVFKEISNEKENPKRNDKALIFYFNRICKFSIFLKQNFNTYKIFPIKDKNNSGKLLTVFFHLFKITIEDNNFYSIYKNSYENRRNRSKPEDITNFHLRKYYALFFLKRCLDVVWKSTNNFSDNWNLNKYDAERFLRRYFLNKGYWERNDTGLEYFYFRNIEIGHFNFKQLNSFNISQIFYKKTLIDNKEELIEIDPTKERPLIIDRFKKICIKLKAEDFLLINEEYHQVQINKEFKPWDEYLPKNSNLILELKDQDIFSIDNFKGLNLNNFDYKIEQLKTHNTLVLEWKIMAHCVWWYWDAISSGNSFIFSLERKEKENKDIEFTDFEKILEKINKDWFSRSFLKECSKNKLNKSTLEFQINNNKFEIVQNRAPFNEEPPEDLKELWLKLQKYLNNPN